MPSTYTTALRITKPATGENSGTWGTIVNDEITTLLETAIAGYTSVAMSDANTTLTTSNGAADQARSMMVNLTGTLTAAREVVIPNVNKVYIIRNSTTGGFAVSVKTTSGSAYSLPNGKIAVLCCDGSNNVFEATNYFSALNLGAGSVSAPALTFSTDGTTGLFRAGANDVRMSVSGTYRQQWQTTGTWINGSLIQSGNDFAFSGSGTADVDAVRVFSTNQKLYLQMGAGNEIVYRNKTGGTLGVFDSGGQLSIPNNTNPGVFVSREAGGQIFGGTNSSDSDWYVTVTAAGAGNKYAFMGTSTATALYFATSNISRWGIMAGGNLLPSLSGSYSIGDASFRPSAIYGVDANFSGNMLVSGSITDSNGFQIGWKSIPRNLSAVANGECFATSSNVTLNTGAAIGTTYMIYNTSAGALTILQGSGLTLRLAGTSSTGNRTLAARGIATIWCYTGTEYIASGAGLT